MHIWSKFEHINIWTYYHNLDILSLFVHFQDSKLRHYVKFCPDENSSTSFLELLLSFTLNQKVLTPFENVFELWRCSSYMLAPLKTAVYDGKSCCCFFHRNNFAIRRKTTKIKGCVWDKKMFPQSSLIYKRMLPKFQSFLYVIINKIKICSLKTKSLNYITQHIIKVIKWR